MTLLLFTDTYSLPELAGQLELLATKRTLTGPCATINYAYFEGITAGIMALHIVYDGVVPPASTGVVTEALISGHRSTLFF